MGLLVAGTKYRGEFEERLKKLMEEIKQNDDIILVSVAALCCCRQASCQIRDKAHQLSQVYLGCVCVGSNSAEEEMCMNLAGQ